ncbi:carboxyl transferase domain-containing protein [Streptosporangium sp. NPDC048047]|uniref:acyl-CoA carboxylase subunit beta n=1 Tax=Streptosporangium sp. NPDC048047 TaxID=3155748 RepID=UPI00344441E2
MTVVPAVPVESAESVESPAEPAADPRDPTVRLDLLLDPDSAVPLGGADGSGVTAVHGLVGGAPVVAYCTDARVMGGALGAAGAMRVVEAIEAAVRRGRPVIGLWHSGGARLADGVESMDGVGRMFAAMTRASGVVPQISVILGPAAGAAAYGPALTDLVVMAPAGRVFVTGPEIVRSVTGEVIDMEGLGGPDAHARRSGVTHVVAADERDAIRRARLLTGFFTCRGAFDLAALREPHETRELRDLRALLPESPRRAYDVRPLVRGLLDADGGFEELQPRWAANILVGLGRLGGRPVGVLANNPRHKGGCLDALSAEKAARFVRMCDAHGVPLVVLVDVPGYLPGVGQEWDGVVRRGAKLLHAFAESVVPRVTLITRKAYGGAYIAMNSRSLGATTTFAWPGAEVAVMGAESAVGVLHRKALAAVPEEEREGLRARLAEEHRRVAGGVERAVAIGVVDEVIAPETTRLRIAEALARAPHTRGHHSNIPL